MYVEWDNPGDGPLETPAVFVDFGTWWNKPGGADLTPDNWVPFLTEMLSAAGFETPEESLPAFPEVDPFNIIAIGVFPARIKGEVWVRVVFCGDTSKSRFFAESRGFSTKWFDELDVTRNCTTCLISFDLYKDKVERPAAEMILKEDGSCVFPEFEDKIEEAREVIARSHGEYHKDLRLCHFKTELTEKGFEDRNVKMYFIATTK
jgi:hypothetical protein